MTLNAWADVAIGAPLLTFFAVLLGLSKMPKVATALSLITAVLACIATWVLALTVPAEGFTSYVVWADTGDFVLHFGWRLTGLSTAMAVIVGTVHLLVQIYSLGYMADDPDKGRYFGVMSLFATAMLTVVMASDLAQLYVAWEIVGLASYLLIGFWSHKPSAAQAAKKAFVMTRFGDLALFFGLVLLLLNLGDLRIDTILTAVEDGTLGGDLVMWCGLLLFGGIAGKSAQFPLHVWLPDAMEGPTPVSSLLHSATMVAAGVYLFALLQPLFLASATTVTFVLCIAVLTALISAASAMVEPDMKRVLAYSSISQLSFMLMGLAAVESVASGPGAGFFHLTTHAAFKCLLFLSAGLFIHLAHSGSMVEIGTKVGRSSRVATFGLVVGGLALMGAPPFAGFMSKEVVLTGMHHHAPPALYAGALLASAMTAYYTARMMLLILKPQSSDPGEDPGDDSGMGIMSGVVVAMGIVALGIGFTGGVLGDHLGAEAHSLSVHWMSSGVAFAMGALAVGLALAWMDFGRAGASGRSFVEATPLSQAFATGFWIDAFWRWFSDRVIDGITRLALVIDRQAIDAAVDGVGSGTKSTGAVVAALQAGRVQLYLSITLGLLAGLVLYLGLNP
jgi:NADH-quinone oxidoreductase subunit L